MKFNQDYFSNLQNKLKSNQGYRRFWEFFSLYAVAYFVVIIFAVFQTDDPWRWLVLLTITVVIARGIISPIIFLFYKKQRPYQKFAFTPVKLSKFFSNKTTKYNSFPSDHVITLASISMIAIFFNPLIGAIGLILSLLVGRGRVIMGFHFPSDVAVGFVLGVLIGFLSYFWLAGLIFTH